MSPMAEPSTAHRNDGIDSIGVWGGAGRRPQGDGAVPVKSFGPDAVPTAEVDGREEEKVSPPSWITDNTSSTAGSGRSSMASWRRRPVDARSPRAQARQLPRVFKGAHRRRPQRWRAAEPGDTTIPDQRQPASPRELAVPATPTHTASRQPTRDETATTGPDRFADGRQHPTSPGIEENESAPALAVSSAIAATSVKRGARSRPPGPWRNRASSSSSRTRNRSTTGRRTS